MPAPAMLALMGAKKASAAPATPPAGYEAWYDASDTASITASGGSVSQWNDKSGNGYHLAGTDKPVTGSHTINSLNVIYFTGTNKLFHDTTPTHNKIESWYVVVSIRTLLAWGGHWLGHTGASDNTYWILGHDTTSFKPNSGDSGWQTANGSSALALNTPTQLSVIQNSTSGATIYKDGTAGTTSGSIGPETTPTGLYICTFSNSWWNMDVAEIVGYSGAHNSTDRAAVESYLKTKWGTP